MKILDSSKRNTSDRKVGLIVAKVVRKRKRDELLSPLKSLALGELASQASFGTFSTTA